MGITLNNTAAGGTVNITLNKVESYSPIDMIKFPVKTIPGKVSFSPSAKIIDTDVPTLSPRKYRIRATITNSEKSTLQTLKSEADKQIKLSDNEQSNLNVRLTRLEFQNNPGYTDYPWLVIIELIAEDH